MYSEVFCFQYGVLFKWKYLPEQLHQDKTQTKSRPHSQAGMYITGPALQWKWSQLTSWKNANVQGLLRQDQIGECVVTPLFQKVNGVLEDSSTSFQSKSRGGGAGGRKGADGSLRHPPNSFSSTKMGNKPLGKMLKIRLFWWNEAVWINETNSFYLNHLWCEMGSQIEKSSETSDCSAFSMLEGRGGGKKMEFLSIYLRINKVISKVTMKPPRAGCGQSVSPSCPCAEGDCSGNEGQNHLEKVRGYVKWQLLSLWEKREGRERERGRGKEPNLELPGGP